MLKFWQSFVAKSKHWNRWHIVALVVLVMAFVATVFGVTFGRWNWWYLGAPAGLVLADAVGYGRLFLNEDGKRMNRIRPGLGATMMVVAGLAMMLWVLAESQAGIVHALSGGMTAEQAARSGDGAIIIVGAGVAVAAVYMLALCSCAERGTQRKKQCLRAQRSSGADSSTGAADASAETLGVSDQTIAPAVQANQLTVIESEPILLQNVVIEFLPRPSRDRSTRSEADKTAV